MNTIDWDEFFISGKTIAGLSNKEIVALKGPMELSHPVYALLRHEWLKRLSGEFAYNPDGDGYNLL